MFNFKTISLLIFIPILYTLLFGGLFSQNVITDVPIVVCNLDDGFDSQQFIQNLYDTPEIKVIAIDNSAADADTLLKQYQVIGVVVIPKNFSKQINSGKSTSIELIVDNTNRMLGGTVSKAVQSVVIAQSAAVSFNQRITAGWNQAQAQSVQLSLSSRMLFNPTNGYIDFFLAALIMHSIQIVIVFAIAPLIISLKHNLFEDTTKSLFTMLFFYSTIMVAVISTCLSIGLNIFHMVCRGNFIDILSLCSAFIFCMVAFALCVGSWLNEHYKALMTPLVYIMPSILFANITWSRSSMDNISLFLSYIMPIGYAADDLRSLFVKGVAYNLHSHILILLSLGLFFSILAIGGVKYHVTKFKARTILVDE